MAMKSMLWCVRCRVPLSKGCIRSYNAAANIGIVRGDYAHPDAAQRWCSLHTVCRRRSDNSLLEEARIEKHQPCRELKLFKSQSPNAKRRRYSERRVIGYTMDELFEVVSHVEMYNTFVPYCTDSTVMTRRDGFLKARMAIGFGPVREQYVSVVTLARPHLVRSECTEGRLFNHLLAVWKFAPGPGGGRSRRCCVLDFSLSFEFRSQLHSRLSNLFFDEVARRMVSAFLQEAQRRHGPADPVTALSSSNISGS